MLRKWVYPSVQGLLERIAKTLSSFGLNAYHLTLAGLLLGFISGLFFAYGLFFLGGLALTLSGTADMLDGPLARSSGSASKFGAFLDSTLDRYSDFFVLAGLSLFFARHDQSAEFLLILGILSGSFLTSYAKARAENFIPACSVGIFERTERILCLIAGTLIFPLLTPMLWILFIGTHVTAVQRIAFTRKALKEKNRPA